MGNMCKSCVVAVILLLLCCLVDISRSRYVETLDVYQTELHKRIEKTDCHETTVDKETVGTKTEKDGKKEADETNTEKEGKKEADETKTEKKKERSNEANETK